ncbi:aspartate aminotransferase family protein [Terriglobus sp. 2YAB30_2]|uniref:aspartate aminotransferase family protein n=1 Tax=unclassified Terriglobus TaxID=2628988 RepID=UPI003F9DC0A6
MSQRYARSIANLERSRKTLAGGVSSNVRMGDKPYPLFFEYGKGSHLWDVDGNEYIDYVLGRGPLILGHTHPEVIEATCKQLWRGQIYAAQHELEFELAERVHRIVPCAERVRFGISGSEAVHGALRLARAAIGRQTVIKFEGQYHGWLDNILYSLAPDPAAAGDALHPATVAESKGQFSGEDSHLVVLPWNNLKAVEEYLSAHANEVAAIITEPVMCNTAVIPPLPGYLEGLRELATRHDVVLIFDEVITGFRASLAGAQGRFNVVPDLTIFGKAIANGMPISCLAGKARYMDLIAAGKVGHGGTYNSIPPAVAGAIATLDVLERNGGAVYQAIEQAGTTLMQGIREAADRAGIPVVVQGYGCIFYLGFPAGEIPEREGQVVYDYRSSLGVRQDLYNDFVCGMVDRGVRIIPRGNWFLSSTHTAEDVQATLAAVHEVFETIVAPKFGKLVSA